MKIQAPEELVKLRTSLSQKVNDSEEVEKVVKELEEELSSLHIKIRDNFRTNSSHVSLGRSPRRRRASEDQIPLEVLRENILFALDELGGGAKAGRVLDQMEKALKDKLKPNDFVLTATRQPSWRSRACLERKKMAREGILKPAAGFWELANASQAK
jgi:hypothetical protein